MRHLYYSGGFSLNLSVEGKNSEIVHDGKRYHVQTEVDQSQDFGIVSLVFCSGQVIYQKKHKVLDEDNDGVRESISRLHTKVLTDIKELLL